MKRTGVCLALAILCAVFSCQAFAGDYFAAHGHDFDWTRNLSVFHTEEYTYLYGEHVYTTENGYWYLPMFTALRLTVRDRDGNERKDGAVIRTGDRVTEQRNGACVVLSTFVYPGDVEADGRIDAADARKTLRAAIGLAALSDAEKEAADLDNDGAVTPEDARTVLRKSVCLAAQEVKEGGFWDDHIYRTTLLAAVPKGTGSEDLAALFAAYDEVKDARILSVDGEGTYVLLSVNTYEAKNTLAEKISAAGNGIEVCVYALA